MWRAAQGRRLCVVFPRRHQEQRRAAARIQEGLCALQGWWQLLLKKFTAVQVFNCAAVTSLDTTLAALNLQGAFSVAAKAKVPVVPITLVGTGALMPNNKEYLLFPGDVKVRMVRQTR
jgi:hypothetical protein